MKFARLTVSALWSVDRQICQVLDSYVRGHSTLIDCIVTFGSVNSNL